MATRPLGSNRTNPTSSEATESRRVLPSHPGAAEPQAGDATELLAADPRAVRVLVVDDHVILREGLAELLRGEQGIHVVGEAADGVEAVELTGQLEPDVVLMDVSMPRMDGIEATRIICAAKPHVRVIALSMHQDETIKSAMNEAGAAAYVSKSGDAELLVSIILG